MMEEKSSSLVSNENGAEVSSNQEQSPSSAAVATSDFWEPTGIAWRDFLHFVGPGWLVSIAYVDPGNYQSDILSGASKNYVLLFAIWWTSLLSIYVQVLCVRLAYYGNMNLAEAQARTAIQSTWRRYMNWFLAELSTVITDLPEVIGIGIAFNIFFGFPYWIGVLLSLLTTMLFLALQHYGIRTLEVLIFVFVAIMSVAIFVEMSNVGVDSGALIEGWIFGFVEVKREDIFTIAGIIGAVVMPHNLYLHTAICQQRRVKPEHVKAATKWGSWEPVLPIMFSFFVNMAVVSIAAESIDGSVKIEKVGLTTFGSYLKHGSALFGIALLAAGQSSAITTTFTGQYVMDGFLNIQLPIRQRAIMTRLIAITPCVLVSIFLPRDLNQMINIVNACLSILLPFAFTPLVKFNCSPEIMGEGNASKGCEKCVLYGFAFLVWLINAITLSVEGGGFFGNWRGNMPMSFGKILLIVIELACQALYAWWNFDCIWTTIDQRELGTTNGGTAVVNGAATSGEPVENDDEEDGDEREII